MNASPLPVLTPDSPDFQAVMDAAFERLAIADPGGLELPGDVLFAFRAAVEARYYLPNKSTRVYLRRRDIRERWVPALNRKYYGGLLLRAPYAHPDAS